MRSSKFSMLPVFLSLLAALLLLQGCGTSPSDANEGNGNPGGTGGTGGNGKGGKDGPCERRTCEDAGAECGWIFDGCGEILECGTCGEGLECGYDEVNRCGACTPRTCDSLAEGEKEACGLHADGCGQTLDCGACPDGKACGDGKQNLCVTPKDSGPDSGVICREKAEACAAAGLECGMAPDGCGGLIDCGACTVAGDTCGGSGVPGVCGQPPPCVPQSCAALGFNCGKAVDNCGAVIDCGPLNCGPGMVCGGGGSNRCGVGGSGNEGECTGGAVTTLTGTVRTPRGASGDPLYGALVYIPKSNADIPLFPQGLTCDRCEDQVPPTAVAHAVTGPDGKFTLADVPSGTQSLVIQLGKWRRKVDVNIQPCVDNALSAQQTRLPTRHNEGNVYDHIPRIAVSTGQVDALECVLYKMGVEGSQFSDPSGNGRIHFYKGSRSEGQVFSPNTPSESELVGDLNRLKQYDAVLLACQAGETTRREEDVNRLVDYANQGGRIFATHFSRDWLRHYEPFSNSANWTGNNNGFNSATGRVDVSFQKGRDFAAWLREVGASTSTGSNTDITIQEARQSISSIGEAQQWIWLPNNSNHVQHMTFNTPMGTPVAQQCGRVVFSDFHVTTGNPKGKTFPAECSGTSLTAQEKVLAFMLFDLASCIQEEDPPPPVCTPKTCKELGRTCGSVGDGCGGILTCGTCSDGLTCGGGGKAGVCGKPACTPLSCDAAGVSCGPAGDGCGDILDCGTCPSGQLCGAGGPGVCGAPVCKPKTCQELRVACGPAGDGCGGMLDCGCCPGSCGGDPQ